MEAPEARYIERDGAMLAYQVVGNGEQDVLLVGETAQHFDLSWTDPYIHEVYERGASYARTVYMQPRGFGLSDRILYAPTLEQHADDILAVMDAAGLGSVTLTGTLTSSPGVALAAARAPHRVRNVVLYRPLACGPLSAAAELHGWSRPEAEAYAEAWRGTIRRWGSGSVIDVYDPPLGTAYNRRLMGMLERCSSTPRGALEYLEWFLQLDISDVLRNVRAPTRVLYAPTGSEPDAVVRRTADLIPNASFHTMPTTPVGAAIGEVWITVMEQVEEAATGALHAPEMDRFLGTVLFTDIVGSTELLARIGDTSYRDVRGVHEREVRLEVERAGGRLVDVTGDGTLSVFDAATDAVRCAQQIQRIAADHGIAVRAGVHVGDLERTGPNVTGLNVHIGARIGAAAGAGEVLVSQAVRDLVVGSGLVFENRGTRELKGLPGTSELFALVGTEERQTRTSAVSGESLETPFDRLALRTARAAPRTMRAAARVGNALQRRRKR